MKLDMERLDEIRHWVLGRENPKEGALFVFSWVVGVCSAAGFKVSELIVILEGVASRGQEPQKKVRHLVHVIGEVLPLVPEEEREFRARLEKVREDATYVAPEQQGRCWLAAGEVFHLRFGSTPPASGWGKQVADIFIEAMGA